MYKHVSEQIGITDIDTIIKLDKKLKELKNKSEEEFYKNPTKENRLFGILLRDLWTACNTVKNEKIEG